MNLQSTKEVSIDISNHRYISLNAKQYDRNLRYILITCKDGNNFISINRNTHFASVRYRKPDNRGVFNACEITDDGRILVELTEQMLAVAGFCYADVVIHKNVELVKDIGVNPDGTLMIEDLHNNEIISTMTFIVNVQEVAFDNEEVESSYEYNKLNDLIAKAESTYVGVMNSCNDSKVAAKKSEDAAKTSETNAKDSEGKAKTSETNAATSEANAKTSETNAKTSETNAATSEANAKTSETNAKTSETNAKDSEGKAKTSETNAATSEANAKTSETNAAISEANAKTSETNAATSETNAKYYYELSARVAEGLVGGFIPIGTITFAELETAEKVTGYVYNISDDFITDDSFREGVGKSYTAGTNVYYTANGEWDCLGGAAPVVATVDEVMIALGIQNEETEEIEEIV